MLYAYLLMGGGCLLAMMPAALLDLIEAWERSARGGFLPLLGFGSFAGGYLAARLSPRRTFIEPAVAGLLVAASIAGANYLSPDDIVFAPHPLTGAWLFGAVGITFVAALVGAEIGESVSERPAGRWLAASAFVVLLAGFGFLVVVAGVSFAALSEGVAAVAASLLLLGGPVLAAMLAPLVWGAQSESVMRDALWLLVALAFPTIAIYGAVEGGVGGAATGVVGAFCVLAMVALLLILGRSLASRMRLERWSDGDETAPRAGSDIPTARLTSQGGGARRHSG